MKSKLGAALKFKASVKKKKHQGIVSIPWCLFGGGEGSRTPVRKPLAKAFYECSLLFKFPRKIANKQAINPGIL